MHAVHAFFASRGLRFALALRWASVCPSAVGILSLRLQVSGLVELLGLNTEPVELVEPTQFRARGARASRGLCFAIALR